VRAAPLGAGPAASTLGVGGRSAAPWAVPGVAERRALPDPDGSERLGASPLWGAGLQFKIASFKRVWKYIMPVTL